MGEIRASATIRNPARDEQTWDDVFLVNTGIVDCLAPRSRLKAIGLAPIGRRRCRLPDGSSQMLDFTVAQIELMGQIGGATIYMMDDAAEPVIGRTTLLSLGLEVDPNNQTLVKRPSILLSGIGYAAESA